MPLVCHMTSRVYVARVVRDLIAEVPSSQLTTLQGLVVIGLVEEEISGFQLVT